MSGPSGELASQWQLVRRQAQRPDVLDRHAERVAERFVLFVRQVFLIPEGGHGAQRRLDRPRQVAVLERQTRHPSVAIGGNAVPRTEEALLVPLVVVVQCAPPVAVSRAISAARSFSCAEDATGTPKPPTASRSMPNQCREPSRTRPDRRGTGGPGAPFLSVVT